MNRTFHNTLSAVSATAVMLTAILLVADPARQVSESEPQAFALKVPVAAPAPAFPRQIDVTVLQSSAGEIEARAERLATELEGVTTPGETIVHVAAFTAEIATLTALSAVFAELPDAVEAAEIAAPKPVRRAATRKRSRQSLAMPYFSFASRS